MRLMVRRPFWLCAAVLLGLFFDGSGLVRCTLAAILLHECAHALAYRLLAHRRAVLHVHPGGVAMLWQPAALSPLRQAAILLAGPAANLLVGAAALLWRRPAAFARYFFAGAQLLLGLFNLLPMAFLDGGQLLALAAGRLFGMAGGRRLCLAAQWLCFAALLAWMLTAQSRAGQAAMLCFLLYSLLRAFF